MDDINLKDMEITDRSGEYSDIRILNIISQTADKIVAKISYDDRVEHKGTPVNADLLNKFKNVILSSEKNSSEAIGKSDEAITKASDANNQSREATKIAEEANENSNNALALANSANTKAEDAMIRVVNKLGTMVKVNGGYVPDFDADTKADKSELPMGLPIGSIITSAVPLIDAGVHLLDGSIVSQTGIYAEFTNYLRQMTQTYPNLVCSNSEFDSDVARFGQCGKFVIDDTNNTLRFPLIPFFIQGLVDIDSIGKARSSALPNIEGNVQASDTEAFASASGSPVANGAFSITNGNTGRYVNAGTSNHDRNIGFKFDAHNYNPIYCDSDIVQPPSVQYPYYVVMAKSVKTDIQVNLDNVATDINHLGNLIAQLNSKVSSNENFIDNFNKKTYLTGAMNWTTMRENGAASQAWSGTLNEEDRPVKSIVFICKNSSGDKIIREISRDTLIRLSGFNFYLLGTSEEYLSLQGFTCTTTGVVGENSTLSIGWSSTAQSGWSANTQCVYAVR